MGKNVLAACAAALALGALSGCGTVENVHRDNPLVYGGVREMGALGCQFCFRNDSTPEHPDRILGGFEFCIGSYFLLIDTPLSAIGDTLTLPYVLYLKAQRDRLADSLKPAAE